MPTSRPTYERQIPAKLIVRLDNGGEFEASPLDLASSAWSSSSVTTETRRFIHDALQGAKTTKAGENQHLKPIIQVLEMAAYAPEELTSERATELKGAILAIEEALVRDARRSEGGEDY